MESLQAELNGEPETLRGRLRVMVPHAFGQAQLLPTMLAFLAQHPQLSLEWILKIVARISSQKASTARCGWALSTNRAWLHCRSQKCRASSWQRPRWWTPRRSVRRNRHSHCRGSRWSPTTANACCCMMRRAGRIRCQSARACSAITCSWYSRLHAPGWAQRWSRPGWWPTTSHKGGWCSCCRTGRHRHCRYTSCFLPRASSRHGCAPSSMR